MTGREALACFDLEKNLVLEEFGKLQCLLVRRRKCRKASPNDVVVKNSAEEPDHSLLASPRWRETF